MSKKRLVKWVQVWMLILLIGIVAGSIRQLSLTDNRPNYCGGFGCVSNADCGNSCFCSMGMCYYAYEVTGNTTRSPF